MEWHSHEKAGNRGTAYMSLQFPQRIASPASFCEQPVLAAESEVFDQMSVLAFYQAFAR